LSEREWTSILKVCDVAALLRVDQKTVYRLAKVGALPGFKVAGTWRFKRDDIEAWIEKQKTLAR
jgi:excisionase family DNA binding protein